MDEATYFHSSWLFIFFGLLGGLLWISATRGWKRLTILSDENASIRKTSQDSSGSTSQFPRKYNYAEINLGKTFPPLVKIGAKSESFATDKRVIKPMPIDVAYDDIDKECVSPTGFSIADIMKIGEFPDYAHLSGIPLPKPDTQFNPKMTKARPYRPFRWPYFQTMSLSKLEPDHWLELDRDYSWRIEQRRELMTVHNSDLCQALLGSELALKELMEVVIQFLCARYPNHFTLTLSKSHPATHTFCNHILGTVTNLSETRPLQFLAENVPEDFAVLLRDPQSGNYHLRAGIICSAVGWNLGEKMGKPLSAIHEAVPDYQEKMERSMDRWFAKVGTDGGIQRGSWSWEMGQLLYWSPKAGPIPGCDNPETIEDFKSREEEEEDELEDAEQSKVHLRVDWQTLRRLPLTGAIVFNFRALFTPLPDLLHEPRVPALALKIITESKDYVLHYKGVHRTKRVVAKALEKYARKQVEWGWVEDDWDVGTLDETPFFMNWQE